MGETILTNASDRELLEMAAKAFWDSEIDDVCSIRWLDADQAIGYTHGDNQDHNGRDVELCWNPLTDDGDALRLAVALNLDILQDPVKLKTNMVEVVANEYGDEERMLWASEHRAPYPYAATRRAIVRAAAAIGAAK